MKKLWRPMLAAKPRPEELDTALAALPYPALFSPKLDGVRATVQNGRLYSRALKLIPNRAMQALWGREELNGLDGEIIVGPPTAGDCFNRTTSVVMSRDKPADSAVFWVFDRLGDEPFYWRLANAEDCIELCCKPGLEVVKHTLLRTPAARWKYEEKMLKKGYEGVMRRDLNGAYKHGRSTLKEGGLVAIKRFVDAEAVILNTYEQERNINEQKVNELGRLKRSSHKAGKVGKGTLGGFAVEYRPKLGVVQVFHVATGVGLTEALRAELWARRSSLIGKKIKFRYQKVGTMEAPRLPVFLGFRDERDL